MVRRSANAPCPCGTGRRYKACCKRLHDGTPAADPESLMRSRYSAYALDLPAYLMATTHPASPHHRPDAVAWKAELRAFSRGTSFDGLTVHEARQDGARGAVRFTAHLSRDGVDVGFQEHSTFERVGDRWLYVAAIQD